MSRRGRWIRPQGLDDPRTAGLSHEAWRLLYGSFVLADDYGNFSFDMRRVVAALFWARTIDDAEGAAAELREAGLWQLYQVEGRDYVHIGGWDDPSHPCHQKVDRPSQPQVPGPNGVAREPLASPSRDTREASRPNRSDPKGSDPKGSDPDLTGGESEGRGDGLSGASPRPSPPETDIQGFYESLVGVGPTVDDALDHFLAAYRRETGEAPSRKVCADAAKWIAGLLPSEAIRLTPMRLARILGEERPSNGVGQ